MMVDNDHFVKSEFDDEETGIGTIHGKQKDEGGRFGKIRVVDKTADTIYKCQLLLVQQFKI